MDTIEIGDRQVKERVTLWITLLCERVTAYSFCKMAVSSKLMRNNICTPWKETTGSPEDHKQNTLDYGFSEDNTKNAAPNCIMS